MGRKKAGKWSWLCERFSGYAHLRNQCSAQAPPLTSLVALYARRLTVSSPRGPGLFTHLLLYAPYDVVGAPASISAGQEEWW